MLRSFLFIAFHCHFRIYCIQNGQFCISFKYKSADQHSVKYTTYCIPNLTTVYFLQIIVLFFKLFSYLCQLDIVSKHFILLVDSFVTCRKVVFLGALFYIWLPYFIKHYFFKFLLINKALILNLSQSRLPFVL